MQILFFKPIPHARETLAVTEFAPAFSSSPENPSLMVPHLQRHIWTNASKNWTIKQVTKSNFSQVLPELKDQINNSDFVSVSLQKTGAFSSPWRRVLPIDTAETAYCKSRDAAEKFELFQFAVCPFRFEGSKIVAFPYNFHLFPRDELKIGIPSYSFSCQTLCLTSMAREGFDFNACIYDGISYLSRLQESTARHRIGNLIPSICNVPSPTTHSVADGIFIERIKSQIRYWRDANRDTSMTSNETVMRSLRKIMLGGEAYGSRPCTNIDVCNVRQVQLVLEMLTEFSDDLVPLIVPDRGGEPKSIRVVLTSSEQDKILLKNELQNLEDEQNKQVRGFREVIDAISASRKPVVAYNCLHDFTFIHSKFLAPLPPTLDEFASSIRLVFPIILDVNHLLKQIGPLRKANNIQAAFSYLKRQFFVHLDMEIPRQAQEKEGKKHGDNVLKITHLFAKVCSVLKIIPTACQTTSGHHLKPLEDYANIFYHCYTGLHDPMDGDVRVFINHVKKVSTEKLVFLWGFRSGVSAEALKNLLCGTHIVFTEEFELRLVDSSCAVVVFERAGAAEAFVADLESGGVGFSVLREMVSEGLKATGYESYQRVCELSLWETDLADSLEKALAEASKSSTSSTYIGTGQSAIYWTSDSVIHLDEL